MCEALLSMVVHFDSMYMISKSVCVFNWSDRASAHVFRTYKYVFRTYKKKVSWFSATKVVLMKCY